MSVLGFSLVFYVHGAFKCPKPINILLYHMFGFLDDSPRILITHLSSISPKVVSQVSLRVRELASNRCIVEILLSRGRSMRPRVLLFSSPLRGVFSPTVAHAWAHLLALL